MAACTGPEAQQQPFPLHDRCSLELLLFRLPPSCLVAAPLSPAKIFVSDAPVHHTLACPRLLALSGFLATPPTIPLPPCFSPPFANFPLTPRSLLTPHQPPFSSIPAKSRTMAPSSRPLAASGGLKILLVLVVGCGALVFFIERVAQPAGHSQNKVSVTTNAASLVDAEDMRQAIKNKGKCLLLVNTTILMRRVWIFLLTSPPPLPLQRLFRWEGTGRSQGHLWRRVFSMHTAENVWSEL